MIKVKVYCFFIVIGGCMLGACTDNGLLFRSTASYEQDQSSGSYYVGEPYMIRGVEYTPSEDYSYREKGVASWYRRDDANRLTSNGEIFDDNAMTAAHKTLPLPSLVRITNLENGNVAIVRVNDRGPNVNNRLIDVSQKVAADLEFPARGTTMVEVEILPDESKRLKAIALGQLTNAPSLKEIKTDEKIIPLGSNQVLYQPDVTVTPLYEEETVDTLSLNEEKEANQVLNEPIDLISDSFDENKIPDDNTGNEIEKKTVKEKTISENDENILVSEGYVVQVGAFSNNANIERTSDIVSDFGEVIKIPRDQLTVIRIGPFKNREMASEVLDKVHQAGYGDAIIQFQK